MEHLALVDHVQLIPVVDDARARLRVFYHGVSPHRQAEVGRTLVRHEHVARRRKVARGGNVGKRIVGVTGLGVERPPSERLDGVGADAETLLGLHAGEILEPLLERRAGLRGGAAVAGRTVEREVGITPEVGVGRRIYAVAVGIAHGLEPVADISIVHPGVGVEAVAVERIPQGGALRVLRLKVRIADVAAERVGRRVVRVEHGHLRRGRVEIILP